MSEAVGPSDSLEGKLADLYTSRFPAADHAARIALWRVLYGSYFRRYVQPTATVVDLGAGYCDFINAVEARRRIAIDLNPQTADYATPGVEVHAVALERLGDVVEPATVDLAFASNVFEHLRSPEALLEVLGAVRDALVPDGRLVILQPNVRALGGAFWDFVDHTLPLTEKGMAEALTLAGFEVVESRARFLPYTTKSRLPQWSWMVKVYLKVPMVQRLLGKQMLVIARRSSA